MEAVSASSSPPPGRELSPAVNLRSLQLQHLEFKRIGDYRGARSATDAANFSMTVARATRVELVVDLQLTVEVQETFWVRVAFQAVFGLPDGRPESGDLEGYWRDVAARIAPLVMFPYIRETVGSLTLKAGFPQAYLPVINAGALFDPATIKFPPIAESE